MWAVNTRRVVKGNRVQTVHALFWLILSLSFSVGSAQHNRDTAWMRECCGERDCFLTPIALIDLWSGVVFVRDREVQIDRAKIRQSQDGNTYWCAYSGVNPQIDIPSNTTIRCVFYAEGV